jgi:Spy/CpxP family protein refolding chaperone
MRSKILATVALVFMLSATAALAAPPAPGAGAQPAPGTAPHARRAWHHHERPLITFMLEHRDDLALTPDQVRGLEQLRSDFQTHAKQTVTSLRSSRGELRQLLAADAVDMAQVEAKVRDIERFRGDLSIARLRAIEQGKSQLSTDQRTKLAALISQAHPGRKGHHGPNAG